MKSMKEMILTLHKAIRAEEKENMAERMDSIDLYLSQVPGAPKDINDESKQCTGELREQQDMKNLLAKMCDDAYSTHALYTYWYQGSQFPG